MTDDRKTHQEKLLNSSQRSVLSPRRRGQDTEYEAVEESCAAFGYLRGIRERADAVEFRFRNGNSSWFPYSLLGHWKYNPSDGMLLKFSGDLVYLILITGSNLDRPLIDSTTNLTTSGIQRHRIVWMREMTEEEIRRVGESGPTIDRIQIAEFRSNEELTKWLEANAPAFLL